MDLTEFRAFAADRLALAHDQLQGLLDAWEEHSLSVDALSGDEYPFSMSLDEQLSAIRTAVEALREPVHCARCGDVIGSDVTWCTTDYCAMRDEDGEGRFTPMRAFIELNPDTMKGLTNAEVDRMEVYAEHHAGGLHVLGKSTKAGYIKLHDTWGPGPFGVNPGETDGPIIVHHYDPNADQDNDPQTWVAHFQTGAEALRLFLSIEED